MDRAKVNGIELEYEVRGAGEPVLLIDMLIADCFVPLLLVWRGGFIVRNPRCVSETVTAVTPTVTAARDDRRWR